MSLLARSALFGSAGGSSHLRPWCLALALGLAASVGACGSDDPGGDADTSPDTDGSGEIPVCESDFVPVQFDPCACEGGTFEGTDGLCTRVCLCANGLYDCEETCDEPPVLTLEWATGPTLVEVTGNGDRAVNPGETWAIEGALAARNTPEGGVAVTLRAATSSAKVQLEDAEVSYSALGEAAQEFSIPIVVRQNAAPGPVVIDIEAFTTGFELIEQTVELEIVEGERALLTLSGVALEQVDPPDGANNVIDAGETWRITAVITNTGLLAAEGVSATASASSESLALTTTTADVGILAPSGTRVVSFPFAVAAEPTDLIPTVQLAVTADNAPLVTTVQEVQIRPPDTLTADLGAATFVEAEGGNDDGVQDEGETWILTIPVSNGGNFALESLTWRLQNYESADGEDPFYVFLGFELGASPTRLAPRGNSQVTATVTIPAGGLGLGRLLFSATSMQRQHAPFAYVVTPPSAPL